MKLDQLASVFVGAGIGGALRYALSVWATERTGSVFPWHTFAINVSGSFLLGVLFAVTGERGLLPSSMRVLLGVGVLGGFTTFSTFSLEGATLFERGLNATALIYLLGSVVAGVLAAVAGLAVGKAAL